MNSNSAPGTHIVGWSHSQFGKFDQLDPETLISDAVRDALADAGLSAADVDSVVIGTFNGGFVGQDFPSSLAINAQPGLRFKPALRVENACATGSAAIYTGLQAIRSGAAEVATRWLSWQRSGHPAWCCALPPGKKLRMRLSAW